MLSSSVARLACAVTAVLLCETACGDVFFMGLGDLPGGDNGSRATAVSADGTVVVGVSHSATGPEAFRWVGGAMVSLNGEPSPVFAVAAHGISADGSIIVGQGQGESQARGFRWHNGVIEDVGYLQGQPPLDTGARGISADGSVIVGWMNTATGRQAFRLESGTMTGLPYAPGDDNGVAWGISADGTTVVGHTGAFEQPCRWVDGEIEPLGWLGTGNNGWAYDASADGSVVVGVSDTVGSMYREAFRWESGSMVSLGYLPGFSSSHARAVSADGSVVVGGCGIAFVWDSIQGMRDLRDVLVTDVGLDLSGWILVDAFDVTPDGRTVVGYGINPDGHEEGFIARIPEPSAALLLVAGFILCGICRRLGT